GRETVATGVVYVPGPCAANVPCHTLLSHFVSVSAANGPSIETETLPCQPAVAPLIVTSSRTTWPTTSCVGAAAAVTAIWPFLTWPTTVPDTSCDVGTTSRWAFGAASFVVARQTAGSVDAKPRALTETATAPAHVGRNPMCPSPCAPSVTVAGPPPPPSP